MRNSDLTLLYEYNYWARDRLLDAADRVDPAALAAETTRPWGSGSGLLTHMLTAEWIWRLRCQDGVSPKKMRWPLPIADLALLRAAWAEEETLLRGFIAGLSAADMDRPVVYTNTSGRRFENPLWHILTHLLNHGTQHRAELGVLLTELGQSPGDFDLIVYLRQR